MKSVALAVLVMGCGGAPAEPLEKPTQTERPPPLVLEGIRPDLDLSTTLDLQSFGRWPLTIAEHPELEPHFDVADALAQPGISWLDLCSRGAASRHMTQHAELGDYLTAWCHVAKEEYDEALLGLGPLLKFEKLRPAIELDAAAILAGGIRGRDAEGALRRANLIELRIVDLASASYFEAGRLDDARDMNRLAQDIDRAPTDTASCTRMVRAIADSTAQRSAQLAYLEQVGHSPRCVHETAIVESLPSSELAEVYATWPTNRSLGYDAWMNEANRDKALEKHHGDQLEEAALELGLRTSRCYQDRLATMYVLALGLHDHYWKVVGESWSSPYGKRLDALFNEIEVAKRNVDRARCERETFALPLP